MNRINFVLLAVLVVCALSAVTSQHRARKATAELQDGQDRSAQLDVEWRKLLIEQRTLSVSSRVEKIAEQTLNMHLPDSKTVRIVSGRPPMHAEVAAHPGAAQ